MQGDVVSQSTGQDHLESGQLGTADVTASTVANIGPGIDFYFGFGVIAVTAGVAAPLTILAATVAVALLAFTVAEFTAAGLGIIGIWWVSHLVTGDTGSMDPVGLYAECSTMATIVILFVYFLTMLSLPVFMWRRHRASFSLLRHVVIPVLGSATLIVPFVELCQPGQPAPYNAFPFIALALVAAAAAIGCLVVHRNPHAGASEGAEA
jgi:amino acid transporter